MPMRFHQTVGAASHVITTATLLHKPQELVEVPPRRKQALPIRTTIEDVVNDPRFDLASFAGHENLSSLWPLTLSRTLTSNRPASARSSFFGARDVSYAVIARTRRPGGDHLSGRRSSPAAKDGGRPPL